MLTKEQINSIKKALAREDDRLWIILGALSDAGRCRIFKVLMNHHDICVTDIAAILGITVPAASQQLRVLERVGLARRERHGQMICYKVRDEDPLVKSLCKLFS